MKKVLLIPFALLLGGCQTTGSIITTNRYQVITPSASMYNCPSIKDFPDPKNLTDIQVGRLIVHLYENNRICKNSLDSIKTFLDSAKARIERGE
jgi:formylmethanofuran:tetrahydromethanopterin formyltransferase